MNKHMQRIAAVALTSALVTAGLAISVSAANAAPITGNITLYGDVTSGDPSLPTNGAVLTSGNATDTRMFYGIAVDQACPAGKRGGAGILMYQDQGAGLTRVGAALDSAITPAVDNSPSNGGTGNLVTGLIAGETNISIGKNTSGSADILVNNKSLQTAAAAQGAPLNTPALATGDFQLRFYCFANPSTPDYVNDSFFVKTLHYDATALTWNIPVAKINTTTSLTGTLNSTTKQVTYTATVAPVSGSGTATGTVDVKTSSATLCSITLSAGNTCVTAALADGSYTATATYNGDAAYNTSASSAFGPIIVGAIDTKSGQITVSLPSTGNTGLTMTGTPSATIAATHVSGNRFTGSADTGAVTITDERQVGAPTWHLAGALTALANGANSIPATDLGWTPKFLGTPGAAAVALGGNVIPAHQTGGTGFDTSKPLAQGDVPSNSSATTTQVYANLSLDTDGNKPAGTYIGTLTLTLTAP